MGVIGSVIVDLEAKSASFESGCKRAGASLDELHSKAGGMDLSKAFGGGGFGIGVAIGAGVEAVHMFVDAAKEAAHAVAEWVIETTKSVTETAHLASTLGTTTSALQALHSAANMKGVGVEELNGGLEHLEKNLGEIATGGGQEAAEALQRLGLDAKQLSSVGADEALGEIADKIKELHSPAEQAAAAFQIFGKSGQQLLPVLQQGSEGLAEAKAHALEFGVALSEIDNNRIVGMGGTFKELQERMEGAKNELTAALAPAITELAQEVLDLLPPADQMREAFTTALHAIGMGVGYLMDIWRFFKIGVLAVATVAAESFAMMLDGIVALGGGMEDLLNALPGVSVNLTSGLRSFQQTVHLMADDLAKQTNELATQKLPHEQVDEWFANANKKSDDLANNIEKNKPHFGPPLSDGFGAAAKKVTAILAELQKEVDTVGMTEGEKKLYDLENIKDAYGNMIATNEQLEKAKKLIEELAQKKDIADTNKKAADQVGEFAKQLNKLQEQIDHVKDGGTEKAASQIQELLDKLHAQGNDALAKTLEDSANKVDQLTAKLKELQEAQKIHEEVETPFEKYGEQIQKLQKLLADGALSHQDYARAVIKAHEDMEKALDKNKAIYLRGDYRVPPNQLAAIAAGLPAGAGGIGAGALPPTPHGVKAGKGDSHGAELLKKADDTLKEEQKQTWYTSEIYRFQRDANSNQLQVADI